MQLSIPLNYLQMPLYACQKFMMVYLSSYIYMSVTLPISSGTWSPTTRYSSSYSPQKGSRILQYIRRYLSSIVSTFGEGFVSEAEPNLVWDQRTGKGGWSGLCKVCSDGAHGLNRLGVE